MICPIVCWSCGKVIADKYDKYIEMKKNDKLSVKEILDNLKLKRYCCRRMILTHIDLIPLIVK